MRIDRAVVIGGDVGVAGVGQMTDGRDEVSLEPTAVSIRLAGSSATPSICAARRRWARSSPPDSTIQGGSFVSTGPFPASMPVVPALDTITPGATGITLARARPARCRPAAMARTNNGHPHSERRHLPDRQPGYLGGGRVEASAGARLRINGHLYVGPNAHLRTNPVGLARDLLIEVAGSDGQTAVMVDSDTELHAW